ncbi:hypothetical protein [Bradyrhizobium sp. 141]|uniref:hypothetical protein n=1 Tax=Bradyrhizobium sp. 141 TaxID=2782617 RepID=UPI001FFB831F|nr:hypothetical protein [Bradyrhizobium sp. 141]MCK1718264.1 hypothetical protein [Bradyrhizobium sp. 141]
MKNVTERGKGGARGKRHYQPEAERRDQAQAAARVRRDRLVARLGLEGRIQRHVHLADTPEAVISTVARPRIVAMVPEPGSRDRSRMD